MVMMIGLVFATVAPLITLLCAVFFVFNFVIWRYHVLYVYERSYEAGGTMWVTFCNLTIYSLMIAQSFLSFVLLSKQAYAGALILWITVLRCSTEPVTDFEPSLANFSGSSASASLDGASS